MKNKRMMLIILTVILLVVASIIIGNHIKTTSEKEMDTISSITLTIKEGTLTSTGATVITKDETGDKNGYGGPCEYKIEKLANNKWEKLYKKENCYSTSQEFYVDEKGLLETFIDWTETYGKLETGKYRLTRNANLKNPHKSYEFSVEFEIK